MAPARSWTREQLYFSGDTFFEAVLEAIGAAQHTIVFETYIFATDVLGKRVCSALVAAARRGVEVRVMVDGVGSPGWEATYGPELSSVRIKYRVFNRPPWARWWRQSLDSPRVSSWGELLRRVNTRNHRKLVVIDGHQAFLGGMNVWGVQLESEAGNLAWRDTGVLVEGSGVVELSSSFDLIWEGIRGRARRLLGQLRRGQPTHNRSEVRINSFRKDRKRNHRLLLAQIESCKKRLWITSAYFVPPGSLLRVIAAACNRGVDVRVLVPRRSDVFFMPWATSAFYMALLRAGAAVYEYQPCMLHAKIIQGDSWAIIGSSNMNHRSILRDVEVDVVLGMDESLLQLERHYLLDLELSTRITERDYQERPLWVRFMSRLMLRIRSIL